MSLLHASSNANTWNSKAPPHPALRLGHAFQVNVVKSIHIWRTLGRSHLYKVILIQNELKRIMRSDKSLLKAVNGVITNLMEHFTFSRFDSESFSMIAILISSHPRTFLDNAKVTHILHVFISFYLML